MKAVQEILKIRSVFRETVNLFVKTVSQVFSLFKSYLEERLELAEGQGIRNEREGRSQNRKFQNQR